MELKRGSDISKHELELLILQMDHELHERGLIVNTRELKKMAERLRKEHEDYIKFTTSTILK